MIYEADRYIPKRRPLSLLEDQIDLISQALLISLKCYLLLIVLGMEVEALIESDSFLSYDTIQQQKLKLKFLLVPSLSVNFQGVLAM